MRPSRRVPAADAKFSQVGFSDPKTLKRRRSVAVRKRWTKPSYYQILLLRLAMVSTDIVSFRRLTIVTSCY